jgi:hypothetical protein
LARFVASLTRTVTLAADAVIAELTSVRTIGDAFALDALFTGAAAGRLLPGLRITRDAGPDVLDRLAAATGVGFRLADLARTAPPVDTLPILALGAASLTLGDAFCRVPRLP